jgi:tetraacyldisaccharide 4'-kinase
VAQGFGERLYDWNVENWLLAPLAWLYALGWNTYEGLYDLGVLKPKEPHKPIVCVGNLVVGGSGKTPVALHVADLLNAAGRKVVLSMSGYGSPASRDAARAPEGPLEASEWGDEPAMARWLRPTLPLDVGRNRVHAAQIVHSELPEAVVVMDDGFQHLPLTKHVSIVIDEPGRNTLCIPAGPYREPRSGLARADLVLPGAYSITPAPLEFALASGERLHAVEKTSPRANVLCAIARPERFLQAVASSGVKVGEVRFMRDHDPLTKGNLFVGLDPGIPLVVTAKDWVKLRSRPDLAGRNIWIAKHDVSVQPHEAFRAWLLDAVDAASKT